MPQSRLRPKEDRLWSFYEMDMDDPMMKILVERAWITVAPDADEDVKS
jgi:hypothetical protein